MSEDVYVNSNKVPLKAVTAVDINDATYTNVGASKPETRDGVGCQTSGGLQKPSRDGAKCLGLLCLLILAGIIGLTVYYITRDQLMASSILLIKEKDQLQSRYDNVSASRNGLQLEVNSRGNCSQGWKGFGCSCYYISSEEKTWQESSEDCDSRDAYLVIANSREEQDFLNDLAVKAWIGLSDWENEGEWREYSGGRGFLARW
ncbi:NKG2-C type II integral membrane protein-like [Centroberyx gerrardi]